MDSCASIVEGEFDQEEYIIMDKRFMSGRFPRALGYHPEWVLAGSRGGVNPLWLTE